MSQWFSTKAITPLFSARLASATFHRPGKDLAPHRLNRSDFAAGLPQAVVMNDWHRDAFICLRRPGWHAPSSGTDGVKMSGLISPPDQQTARLRPFFPKSHGKSKVDDRHVFERPGEGI